MRSSRLGLLLVVLSVFGYTGSYCALRLGHVLVHGSLFISEEGYNAHHAHFVESEVRALEKVYAPLIELELRLQRTRAP